MGKENVDSIMYEVNQLMKSEEIIDGKIEYILVNKQNEKHSIALVSDKYLDIYQVTLKDKEIIPAEDWFYSIDTDVFELLEKNYEIGFMSLEFHSSIWGQVEDIGIEEFEHKVGLQKYLKYCKNNNIDKKAICKKVDTDVPDIMKYYNEKTDYVEIKNGQVEMSVEMYRKENEVQYVCFCLGYDLLNDKLSRSETDECDRVYDFCDYLARKFVETDYYKNRWKSTYDNLKEWLEDNKEIIQSEYLYYFKLDNMHILETGQRNEEKVALVEHRFEDGTKEYIIAFHYEIDERKLEWGYGYYYANDISKAKEDFEKVKAGGNLADTFENNKKEIIGYKTNNGLNQEETKEIIEQVKSKREFVEKVIKSKKNKERER